MAISPQYQAYLNSPKWKIKRHKVLVRAKFKCERCKSRQATQIHHKTYRRIFNEPLTDLLAVCAPCHRKIHGISKNSASSIFYKTKEELIRLAKKRRKQLEGLEVFSAMGDETMFNKGCKKMFTTEKRIVKIANKLKKLKYENN